MQSRSLCEGNSRHRRRFQPAMPVECGCRLVSLKAADDLGSKITVTFVSMLRVTGSILATVASVSRSPQWQRVLVNVWPVRWEYCITGTGQRIGRYATAASQHYRPPSESGRADMRSRCRSALLVSTTLGIVAYFAFRHSHHAAESPDGATAGNRKPGLPDIRKSDIKTHKDAAAGIWVTFRDGVYDVTDFVAEHPGDKKILLAAGGAVDGFWDFYAIHHTPHVYRQLEQLRIGNLHPDDAGTAPAGEAQSNKAFLHEPRRSPVLAVHSARPFNAEPPAQMLIDDFITPTALFFVRNHLPVPEPVDSVTVDGVGIGRSVNMSVSELKTRFNVVSVTTAMQCAGNRRREMDSFRSVKGLEWGSAAIGNATWTGVRLSDVLAYAGVRVEDIEHVIFQGGDSDAEGTPYEASIPAATALDPHKDVLLAFEMNGEPLTADHGAPCRVIVPGFIGARQVKWLRRITASRSISESHWQRADYKIVPDSFNWASDDIATVMPIYEYPVQSAICDPADGSSLDAVDDTVVVRGYAWSGGGRGILGVDVSVDGGTTWTPARLDQTPQKDNRQWAWTLFDVEVPVPCGSRGKKLNLMCRAFDIAHNSQPQDVAAIWNQRGLLHNAYHRVAVRVPAS